MYGWALRGQSNTKQGSNANLGVRMGPQGFLDTNIKIGKGKAKLQRLGLCPMRMASRSDVR